MVWEEKKDEIDWVTAKRIKSSVETRQLFNEAQCKEVEARIDRGRMPASPPLV
jgi:hypothetical protein